MSYRLWVVRFLIVAALLTLVACAKEAEEKPTDTRPKEVESTMEKPTEQEKEPETAPSDAKDSLAEEETGQGEKKQATASDEKNHDLKKTYEQKLDEARAETERLFEAIPDDSTYALKNYEGGRFDIWNPLMNDVYEAVLAQLSSAEAEQLRIEQAEWVEERDQEAKVASLHYEGGTLEQLEYTMVLNNWIVERTVELVERYLP